MEKKHLWNAFLVAITSLPYIVASVDTTLNPLFERQAVPSEVNFNDCYVRWNKLQTNQPNWQDAQVKTPAWTTTPQQFTDTIEDFSNTKGQNVMLWLESTNALQYSGFFTCDGVRPFDAQAGLDGDQVTGTIILPSGVAKLNRIAPVPNSLYGYNLEAASRIFGIANKDPNVPLTPDDYAYFKNGPFTNPDGTPKDGLGLVFKKFRALNNREKKTVPFNKRTMTTNLTAITGNGDMIKIKFTGLF